MHRIQFSTEPLPLPWYRIADAIGRDGQKNSEEVADRINTALDNLQAPGQAAIRDPAKMQKIVSAKYGVIRAANLAVARREIFLEFKNWTV